MQRIATDAKLCIFTDIETANKRKIHGDLDHNEMCMITNLFRIEYKDFVVTDEFRCLFR